MNNSSGQDDMDTEELLSNPLASLSSVEVSQHIELCIKLAGENKINQKNCFQLHLISMLKSSNRDVDSPDFQLASLILQASSKIYSGRVECLYKDTFTFYSQLHTMLNKDSKAADNDNQDNNDEDQPTRKKKEKPKCKEKFLGNAKNLSSNLNLLNKPHDSFEMINSAFSTSYAGPKLLNLLCFENDSAPLSFASNKCFRVGGGCDAGEENTRVVSRTLKATFEECSSPFGSRPVLSSPNVSFNNAVDNDSFVIADCVASEDSFPSLPIIVDPPKENPHIDAMINRFSALDITSDQLANDVASALNSSTGEMIVANLPPNSILKKVLKDKPTVTKTRPPQTEKKEKPKFFLSKVILKSSFSSKRNISKFQTWQHDNCANRSVEIDQFFMEPDTDAEYLQDSLKPEESAELLHKVLSSQDRNDFSRYFTRQRKHWRKLVSDHKSNVIIRPSLFRASFDNNQDNRSFDDVPSDNPITDDAPNDDFMADSEEPNHFCFSPASHNLSPRSDGPVGRNIFPSDDLSNILVQVPETVKPINIHYQKKEIVINTDHLKKLLSQIIDDELSTKKCCAFLDVFYRVKTRYLSTHKEEVSQQHVFVFLLILANEKILLLENDDNGSITITADENECVF